MERTGASRPEEERGGAGQVGAKPAKSGFGRLLEIAGAKKGLVILSCVLSVISTLASFIPYISIYTIIEELLKHSANLQEADTALLIRWG